MRPGMVGALSGLLLLGLAGCAGRVAFYRGLYEGLQTREEMANPSPAYRSTTRRLAYPEYEAERQRLLDEGPTK